MFLKLFLNYFFILTLTDLPYTGAENIIRAVRGESVHLPCHLIPYNSDRTSIVWSKKSVNSTDICKYQIDHLYKNSSGGCLPRFTFDTKSFNLSITNVQPSDFGNFICKMSILIPPPTLDFFTNVLLYVEDSLSLQRLNSSNSSCVHLCCSLEAMNPEQVNFTWSREGQRSPLLSSSVDMSSELRLCKPGWEDGDTITCQADYLHNKALSKKIQLHSSPAVPVTDKPWSLIMACGSVAGLIVCLLLIAVLCKRRKRRPENGSVVFTNKVYENFSFGSAVQPARSADRPRREECIYEN